jgi:hypothetical protein
MALQFIVISLRCGKRVLPNNTYTLWYITVAHLKNPRPHQGRRMEKETSFARLISVGGSSLIIIEHRNVSAHTVPPTTEQAAGKTIRSSFASSVVEPRTGAILVPE